MALRTLILTRKDMDINNMKLRTSSIPSSTSPILEMSVTVCIGAFLLAWSL